MANVLITGANRGIGLELARQYAENGDRVFAFTRSPGKAGELNDLAKSSGGRVSVLAMDVGDPQSIATAARDLGDEPIDILINNAGILGGQNQTLENIDFQNWTFPGCPGISQESGGRKRTQDHDGNESVGGIHLALRRHLCVCKRQGGRQQGDASLGARFKG
jgi:hypothetical protein